MRGKSKYSIIAFSIRLGLIVGILQLLGHTQFAHANPDTLYVAPDGNDANNCASVTNSCRTIQHAVDVAQTSDDIRVATGTYTGVSARNGSNQLVYINKTVTIRGGYTTANWTTSDPAANPTTLDAQGKGRVLVIREAGPTIENFTITGGGGYFSGGGINVENASPTIRGNQIVSNSANGDGGAIFVNRGSARILNNHISSNTADWAGGIRIINDADVSIIGNQIVSNEARFAGGGIELECCGGTTPLVAQNFIINNNGGFRGGGVSIKDTHVKLVNNILVGNQAGDGAGIFLVGMASYPVSATLLHNTLVGSLAGGEAVWCDSDVVAALKNNIIVSHTVGITNTAPTSSTVTADHILFYSNGTDYEKGVNSSNEVHGSPAFINPDNGDYHIGLGSAAKNKGVDAGVADDIDGDSRPQGAGYDVGADEFYPDGMSILYKVVPAIVAAKKIKQQKQQFFGGKKSRK